ncbi:synaptotagmin-6-like [Saccoglossus kowalevskii]|uniref:Synaptotagmin-6-like n=1 Tax=Saccoglossus kowalevskii TaxID=10224 RepID=A0ABM0M837_SACKO|nr:PREDICTED: synaptotagmin-6-like [Saccoglossus kowalevskii]
MFFSSCLAPPPKSRTFPNTTYEGPNVTKSMGSTRSGKATHQISPESMSFTLKGARAECNYSETESEGNLLSPGHSTSTSASTSASNLASPNDTYSSLQFNVQKVNGTGKYGSGLKTQQYHNAPDLSHGMNPAFSNGSSERVHRGTVQFSLCHDQHTGHLLIMLFQVKDLPPKEFSGTSDPYVRIKIIRENLHGDRTTEYDFQSKVLRKTLDPVFDEKFEVAIPIEDQDYYTVKFIACDFDKYSRHDVIGEVVLPLAGMELSKEQVLWMDFNESIQEYRGEMLLSLSYLPTSERLSIVVMKAKNLQPHISTTENCDPYVKVTLIHRGKKVKRKKTVVCKNERNPIFNEALPFDVPLEEMDKVRFIISVCNRYFPDSDSECSGKQSEVIGQVIIGNGVSIVAQDHWMEMLRSPRKPVAQWYTLKE